MSYLQVAFNKMNTSVTKTPVLFNNLELKNNVYDPAEDTFLFLDALEKDFHRLINSKPSIILEIGPGSGCIGVFLLNLFEIEKKKQLSISNKAECVPFVPFYVGVDLNSSACQASVETASLNKLSSYVDVISSSLFCSFRGHIADIILFNPPYVVTDSEDVAWVQGNISASWAGGKHGREVIDAFIAELPTILSPNGSVYLLAEARNNIPDIIHSVQRIGFSCDTIIEKKCRNEFLTILRFYRA